MNVYLDGEFGFGVAKVLAAQLRVGDRLSPGEVAALEEKDAFEEARKRVLRLIGRRPRSKDELRRYLDRREVAGPVRDAVISSLEESGLIDDGEFAETWVENRTTYRPRGAFALRSELKQKGVARHHIEAALDGFDEEAAARKAAREAAGRYEHLSWHEFRRKLGAYLGRRGFPYGLISAVVGEVWQETAEKLESEGTP